MAKLYTTPDLLKLHGELRSVVNGISKQTHAVRRQAAKAKADAEKLYDGSGMSKTEVRNAVSRHVEAFVDTHTKPIRALLKPKLKEMEGIRLRIEEARENMTNPVRRLNALTMMESKLIEQRYRAMQLTHGAGPAELEVIADAAKTSGDLGMLAAVVARNNQLPSKDRRFSNAELLADVALPGQDDVDAVYAEAVSLPAYAIACDRAFDRLGEIKPEDRLANALAERTVELKDDGSLADFVAKQPRDHVEDDDGDEPKADPKDFSTWSEFAEAGGDFDDLTEADHARFWPIDAGGES